MAIPQNRHWVGQDDLALEGEQQHQRDQESDDRDWRQNVEKALHEPRFTLLRNDPLPRAVARDERQGDVDSNRQQQRLPRNR
jgi:hypothetical protein